MNLYTTTQDAENLLKEKTSLNTYSSKCDCGQSYAIDYFNDVLIICDNCYLNAAPRERFRD